MMDEDQFEELLTELTDGINTAGRRIANAISADAAPGTDETGGTINSLTEAVMGVTAGLCRVASSISDLAEAVAEHSKK